MQTQVSSPLTRGVPQPAEAPSPAPVAVRTTKGPSKAQQAFQRGLAALTQQPARLSGGVVQWTCSGSMSRSSGPASTGTEQPSRGVKPGRSEGPREAEWIVSPLSGARGRWRLRHVDPLETEGGVGVPSFGPP